MQRGNHNRLFAVHFLPDRSHDRQLVMQIQRASGLIQQDHLRRAHNGLCHSHHLRLPAAQIRNATV